MFTNYTNHTNKYRSSFTLIELLVVLALVAILSVVVIMTLNPAELLKQARDSNRLSDLATINTALNLFSTDVIGGFMGTSTVVYVSIPDNASSTCGSLGLPALPTGWTYNCATSQNLRNTDGTGWIPVNFGRISSNTPISQLPIDPINTTSTRLYYTYIPGGSWELNATVEATKNKLGGSNDLTSKDGGSAPSLYELGNNLNLNPIEQGDPTLVGYWNFEEGPNATSTDRSGYGNHGTWYGTGTHYASGKAGSYSAQFNGSDDWIGVLPSSMLLPNEITILVWMNISAVPGTHMGVVTNKTSANYGINLGFNSYVNLESLVSDGSSGTYFYSSMPGPSGIGAWHHAAVTHSSANNNDIYYNGAYKNALSKTIGYQATSDRVAIGAFYSAAGSLKFNGYIDEVRIYNRALSAAEILAIYNATK